MLEAKEVVKSFDGFRALDSATLTVPKGTVYGLVGPNGAGKSTIIRHFTGVYRPDSGQLLLEGAPIWENTDAKRRMVVIPDDWYYFPQGVHCRDGEAVRRGVPLLLLGAIREDEAGVPPE